MEGKKTATVIVGGCTADGSRSVGFSLRQDFEESETISGDFYYRNLKDLVRDCKILCKQGLFVMVRPNFNDVLDDNGEVIGFREWRSFNGEDFREVKFT